jgi:hypothetical protein
MLRLPDRRGSLRWVRGFRLRRGRPLLRWELQASRIGWRELRRLRQRLRLAEDLPGRQVRLSGAAPLCLRA